MSTAADPYLDPSLYDILHAPGSRAEAEALLRIRRQVVGRDNTRLSVLEPACGSGRLLRPLARRARELHGFDRSRVMLDYAAARLPDAHLFQADMESFRVRLGASSIDLALNTINSIRHLESDAALQRHLGEMAAVLAPGGLYLVGLSLCEYEVDEPSEDQWVARRGRLTLRQLIQYVPPPSARARERFEEVYAHVRIERPRGVELRDHHYRLRAYDRAQWERQIERSPLLVLGHFDDRGRALPGLDPSYTIYALGAR